MFTKSETKKSSRAEQQLYKQVATVDTAGDGEKDLEADTIYATEIEPLDPQSVSTRRATVVREPPPIYGFASWFVCLCCCWPIGLYAIAMSATVENRMANNDFEGAYRASKSAKQAVLAAVIIGVPIQLIIFLKSLSH